MEKFLNPNHPIRCIITRPSDCGKSVILKNLFLIFFDENDETYIFSTSLHQDFYQNVMKLVIIYQFT